MNNVVLIGRLTKKPDFGYTANTQTAVAKFTLAVDRPKRNGEDQGADFIRINVFGKQAEACGRYLDKGRQICVQGKIQTGSYDDRNTGQKVYTTDVVADRVEFLSGQQTQNTEQKEPRRSYDPHMLDDMPDTFSSAEDDIPF